MKKLWSYLFDACLVLVFVGLGRSFHAHEVNVAGMWRTAWPFLAGLTIAWSLHVTVLRRLSVMRQGLLVWGDTVILGLLMRMLAHQGVQWSFVAMTTVVLGAFFLSWRWLYVATRKPKPGRRPRSAGK